MSTDKKRAVSSPQSAHRPGRRTGRSPREDRTDVLVTALREYLQDAAHDDALTQEIAAAYYDDEISFRAAQSARRRRGGGKPEC